MKPYDENQCAVCPRPGKACSRCNCSFYCSKECQKVDWPLHRTLCASFARFKDRPSPQVRRGIHFPVNRSSPEFVWLPMNKGFDYQEPDRNAIRKAYFGDSDARTWPVSISEDVIPKSELHPEIMLTCGMYFAVDGSPLNRCIFQLCGKTSTFWRGPAVAYGSLVKSDENDEEYAVVADLDTTDLTGIIKHVLSRFQKGKQMHCVRIYSSRHMGQDNPARRFKSAVIQSSPTFANDSMGHESQISRLFGMPLIVIFRPSDDEVDCTTCSPEEGKELSDCIKMMRLEQPSDSSNMTAALLMISCGGKSPYPADFGEVPERFTSTIAGDAIVVRRDGRPLVPAYLEAFCKWVKEDMHLLFAQTRRQSTIQLSRSTGDSAAEISKSKQKVKELQDEVLKKITRARFYAYCKDKGVELRHY